MVTGSFPTRPRPQPREANLRASGGLNLGAAWLTTPYLGCGNVVSALMGTRLPQKDLLPPFDPVGCTRYALVGYVPSFPMEEKTEAWRGLVRPISIQFPVATPRI